MEGVGGSRMGEASQRACTIFVAEAIVEVAAFPAGWRGAESEAFKLTKLPVKEFFPFHIVDIRGRERREPFAHQPRELPALQQAEILPKVPGGHGAARDNRGDPARQRRTIRFEAREQVDELRFFLVEGNFIGFRLKPKKISTRPAPIDSSAR